MEPIEFNQMNEENRNRIKHLLMPLFDDEGSRRSIIQSAFWNHMLVFQIDYKGPSNEFTDRLVWQLYNYGTVDSGYPALVMLLKTVYELVGIQHQDAINVLVDSILQEVQDDVTAKESYETLQYNYPEHLEYLIEKLITMTLDSGFVDASISRRALCTRVDFDYRTLDYLENISAKDYANLFVRQLFRIRAYKSIIKLSLLMQDVFQEAKSKQVLQDIIDSISRFDSA